MATQPAHRASTLWRFIMPVKLLRVLQAARQSAQGQWHVQSIGQPVRHALEDGPGELLKDVLRSDFRLLLRRLLKTGYPMFKLLGHASTQAKWKRHVSSIRKCMGHTHETVLSIVQWVREPPTASPSLVELIGDAGGQPHGERREDGVGSHVVRARCGLARVSHPVAWATTRICVHSGHETNA